MATRTIGDARFDHGAQHFGARSDSLRAHVAGWIGSNTVRRWFDADTPNRDGSTNTRYVGVGGMRRIPELLAANLDVRLGEAVIELAAVDRGVAAVTGAGEVARADAVILSMPVPQMLQLLDTSAIEPPTELRAQLQAVSYHPSLTVMARLAGPAGLPDGHLAVQGGPVAWLADNQHKGTSSVPSVTIQSTPQFAVENLEEPPGSWVPKLCNDAARRLGSAIIDASGHRWRYAEPRTTFEIGAAMFAANCPVVLAGEVFSGAKVEGAFLSGIAAATTLLGTQ
jgi:predicted NAD/FAD-dependent oxidoreductase